MSTIARSNELLFADLLANFLADNQVPARLTCRHFALKTRQGWLLHPDVRESVGLLSNPRIVDLVAENGILVLRPRSFPQASVTGFDTSLRLFPASHTWPSNAQPCLVSFSDPIPPVYQAYFDVVHVRPALAMSHEHQVCMIVCAVKMLKPGGWLQWDQEIRSTWWAVEKGLNVRPSESKPSAIRRMFVDETVGDMAVGAGNVPRIFQKLGMLDIVGFEPDVTDSKLPVETELMKWAVRENARLMLKKGY